MKDLFFLLVLLGFLWRTAPAQLTFAEDPAKGTLSIRDGKTAILTYCFGDQVKSGADPRYAQSCYIHPLFSLDGRALTDDSPGDHPHHHGLFWTWPIVKTRGIATSTWEYKLPRLRQHFVSWRKREAEGGTAVLGAENAWKLDGQEIVAREFVTLRVHAAGKLGRAIDIELKIEAVGGPIELQGRPDENKGYGGLCFRGSPEFTGAAMTTDKGLLNADSVHSPYRWADLSTRDFGVSVFASPGHPDFPPKWMIRNSYAGIINVSWPGLAPVILEPGVPATLRYRVYIHRGCAGPGGVGEAYADYVKCSDGAPY